MRFQQETLSTSLEEAKPLLQKHWDEIAHYKDIPLDPDYDAYFKLESAGILKVFTARDENKNMLGYAVFVIQAHPHYKNNIYAKQDVVYIDCDRRGIGMFFIRWCDERLATMGIHVVTQHVKAAHNFGPALNRLGYELQDLIYTKRLNK